ncbi:TPA: hypothetical protein ACOJPK_003575 [Pseudomonas putida]
MPRPIWVFLCLQVGFCGGLVAGRAAENIFEKDEIFFARLGDELSRAGESL